MSRTLVIALLAGALCLAGCKKAGEPGAGIGGQAGTAGAAAGAGGAGGPTAGSLADRVSAALKEKGFKVGRSETLPTQLGDRPQCKATERRRFLLSEGYVIVGTYASDADASACLAAFQAFAGPQWERYKTDYFQQGRYVVELNPNLSAEQKAKAREAVTGALK